MSDENDKGTENFDFGTANFAGITPRSANAGRPGNGYHRFKVELKGYGPTEKAAPRISVTMTVLATQAVGEGKREPESSEGRVGYNTLWLPFVPGYEENFVAMRKAQARKPITDADIQAEIEREKRNYITFLAALGHDVDIDDDDADLPLSAEFILSQGDTCVAFYEAGPVDPSGARDAKGNRKYLRDYVTFRYGADATTAMEGNLAWPKLQHEGVGGSERRSASVNGGAASTMGPGRGMAGRNGGTRPSFTTAPGAAGASAGGGLKERLAALRKGPETAEADA